MICFYEYKNLVLKLSIIYNITYNWIQNSNKEKNMQGTFFVALKSLLYISMNHGQSKRSYVQNTNQLNCIILGANLSNLSKA